MKKTPTALSALFTEHPASVGETYGQHMASASSFAFRLMGCGLVCLIHAVLPFLFEKTASNGVQELYRRMVAHRSRLPVAAQTTRDVAPKTAG